MSSDYIEIDQVLHNIIAGRKRGALRGIREQTSTNIYFPSPMLGLTNYDSYGMNGVPTLRAHASRIWITGETYGVRRAKEMLNNLQALKVRVLWSHAKLWSHLCHLVKTANSSGRCTSTKKVGLAHL
jgi:hypothetical protein